MIIVLIGYMGSGKSSIGRHLASVLGYEFKDLDTEIETVVGSSIPNIFEARGEIYFRKLETQVLAETLGTNINMVLALGGGTPCYGHNMKLITDQEGVRSFYLKTSIGELSKRLFVEKAGRPLIAHIESEEDLQEFIGKHLFERVQYYNQSTITITTDEKDVSAIVEEIVLTLI